MGPPINPARFIHRLGFGGESLIDNWLTHIAVEIAPGRAFVQDAANCAFVRLRPRQLGDVPRRSLSHSGLCESVIVADIIGRGSRARRSRRRSNTNDRRCVGARRRPASRYGYRRLHTLVAREGIVANHKRVHRVYREASLQVRRRRRNHLTRGERIPLAAPNGPRERWSMDFMTDTLADGRVFRTLNIVDDFTRECVVD